jgi:ATP-dependent RNA helicase SUPV3L1/SUV3
MALAYYAQPSSVKILSLSLCVVTVTQSSPKTPDVQALDALTGGAFAAQTSGERAAKLRDWLLTEPSQENLQLVYKELSTRDKGAAKVLREKLDELKRVHGQDVLATEWAERATAMLSAPRVNIADAMAWQRDAAKAGAPLSREPLAGLKQQLNEKIKAVEDLQHQVMVQRETAVLLTQRIEVLSTKSLKEADAANEVLQADVAQWQQQAQALTEDPAWQSVDLKFVPQLDASRLQLNSVWEAFEAALFQAKAARDDANEVLPSVPVWAEELRLARGGHSTTSEAKASAESAAPNSSGTAQGTDVAGGAVSADGSSASQTAKAAKASPTKMDPAQRQALREAANQAVTAALDTLAAENNPANLAALQQALKDHGRLMDTQMDLKVHEALIAAGESAGWQRYVADQVRLALVVKAEALFKKVPVKAAVAEAEPAKEPATESVVEAVTEAPKETQETQEVDPAQKTEVAAEKTEAVAVKESFQLEPAMGGRKMQEALRQLREEWKKADQGGLPNHGLWKRFDTACNNAYKVVQTWLDKIKHEASEHRAQRLALIEEVKAWGEANAQNADWRAHLRALHQFGDRWRGAGHLSEKAFAELQPLWKQALQTAAAPLEAAQKASTARRQALIAEAEQLGAAPLLRVDAVKALQQSWQTEAQSVPMDRRIEQKMWEAFRKPIDEAFSRKTQSREQPAAAALSAHDRLVLDASNALKAANASGDVQKIKSAMAALDAAIKGQTLAKENAQVKAQEVANDQVSQANSESTPEATPEAPVESQADVQAEHDVVDAPSEGDDGQLLEQADAPTATPTATAKPARPLVAMRGDDRPGQKKSVPAPAGRGGPSDRRDGKGGQRFDKGGMGDKAGGRFDRGDRGDRFEPRPERGPRLGDAAFRAQRDALEHAELALRKLAAQAHGESLTHLLTAWEKRQADLVPTANDLGRNVNAAARAAWTQAVTQAPKADAGEAILRLEMAAEVPTPAENLNERRALQLQLLTRKNQPGPAETWALDVTAVLSSTHDAKVARRLQNALKNLLRR